MKNKFTHSGHLYPHEASRANRLRRFFQNNLKLFFLTVLFAVPALQLLAQTPPDMQWEAHYGSNTNDTSKNVLPTSDGGYLLVGRAAANTGDVTGSGFLGGNGDGWVTKLNASGAIAWKKAYGTSNTDLGIQQAIEVSDGYVLVGSRYFSGGVSTDKFWYAKISKTNGAITWEREYTATFQAFGYAIASTTDGGYLVGGEVYDNGRKAVLLKTNSLGVVSTSYTAHPSGGLWGEAIVQIEKTPDNGYLLLGRYYDSSEPGCHPLAEVPDPYDLWMCKFSSTITPVWSKIYGGTTTDLPRDVAVTPNGDIFALGNTGCTGTVTGPNNVGIGDWVLHTNSSGVLEEVVVVSVNFLDFQVSIYGIGLSCDNQILICGRSGGQLGTSALVFKMTTNLDITWSYYTEASIDIPTTAYDVVKTSDNGYIVVGAYYSTSKLNDFYALKLTADVDCATPATGFCDKAITVTCGQYLANQSNAAETNSITSYPCVSNGTFPGKDKVYKIVLSQASDLQVGLEIGTTGVDLDLFLLSNNCTTVTCLDTSLTSNSLTKKEGIVKSLAAGTYYIVVDASSSTATSSFNIDFACGELNCTNPPTLTCDQPYSSTTVGAANNVSIYKQTPGMADDVPGEKFDVNNAGPEKLHKFTITQQETVTITLSGVAASTDLEMFLLSSCSKNNCIAKSTNAAGQNEVIVVQLNAGTYYVAVDGFRTNSGSYTLTVDCNGCPEPSTTTNCSIVKYYYSGNGTNLQYTFTANQSIAPGGYSWQITGNNTTVVGGTGTSFTYNFTTPGSYEACFPYLLPSGCVEYCCINICVANPFDCDNSITPTFDPNANGWRFTLSGTGLSNIQWRNDATGQYVGTGAQSNLMPVPVPCSGSTAQSVSAIYFDGSCYRVCCFRYYPCNPFNCGLITYSYDAAQSGYRFQLNTIGGFDAATIKWTVDFPTTQALGTGSVQSNLLPLPVNCSEYWVSVRFRDGLGSWVICCIKIYVCNPVQCAGEITATWITGGQITLSVNTGYQNVQWKLMSGTLLGSTNSITIPNPGSNSDVCVFYRDAGNIWRICCKNIGAPPNPASDLTFDIDDSVCGGNNTVVQVPVRVRNFNNITTYQMSIGLPAGTGAQLQSIQSGSLPGTSDFQVINTTTGALLWYNSIPVTVADNTVICTLNILLNGAASDVYALNFTNNPVSISAEQSISGVFTQITPVVSGGSVCITSNVSISGQVVREDNVGIGSVTVHLSGSSTQTATTDSQGNYAFSPVPSGGTYTLTPQKDINDKNGVNGGDLVAIQRHILGITPLGSPYKRIAADANNSKTINGGDLVAIQRLILALDLTLPLNTSWRFVDKQYAFSTPTNPWSPDFPPTLTYTNLSANVTNADFTGIKIADVNLTNTPASIAEPAAEDRQQTGLELETDDFTLDGKPRTIILPLQVSAPYELESFQFTLQFDPAVLRFKSISGSERIPGFNSDNLNLNRTDKGYLSCVWANADGSSTGLNPGDVLVWVEFESAGKTTSDRSLKDVLQLNGALTSAIATTAGGRENGISLQFKKNASGSLHYFVAPNPFSRETYLHLFLPDSRTLEFALFNLTGQEVYTRKMELPSGSHTLPIGCPACRETQMLFYRIRCGSERISGKLFYLKNDQH